MTRIWWAIVMMAAVVGGVWAVRAETGTTISAGATPRLNDVKDVVVLKELMNTYEAVPFAHRKHAEMAEMGDGCKTCHHREPAATQASATQVSATRAATTTKPEGAVAGNGHAAHVDGNGHGISGSTTAAGRLAWQGEAVDTPSCKTCHPPEGDGVGLEVPSLKGAYHRQCLNCHREWMEANACAVCHAVRAGVTTGPATTMASRDDIVGRMHKPMVPPKDTVLTAKYLPADGRKVAFGHERHVKGYGASCASCHQKGNCSSCHSAGKEAGVSPLAAANEPAVSTVMRGGSTWPASHRPCASCHEGDRCKSCHYEEGAAAPAVFEHGMTGQALDKDHAGIACVKCHAEVKIKRVVGHDVTCGNTDCHKRPVTWPAKLPGPNVTVVETKSGVEVTTTTSAPAPTTRPLIIKIRRGGS